MRDMGLIDAAVLEVRRLAFFFRYHIGIERLI